MIRATRFVYMVLAWLFVACVAVQVFLAGLVVVAGQIGWDAHRGFGHMLAAPLLLMLVAMYLGRQPLGIKRLTWLLFGVYVLQADVVIFLRSQAPVISAFHPVLALADFALGLTLARRAGLLVRDLAAASSLQPSPETQASQ